MEPIDLGSINLGKQSDPKEINLGTIDLGGGTSTWRRGPDFNDDFNNDFRIEETNFRRHF